MAQGATLPSSRSAWLKASTLLLASFVAVAALSLQVRPGSEIVAVVFPPWWSAEQSMLAAGSADAAIVRTTATPAPGSPSIRRRSPPAFRDDSGDWA
jgi:hypothetical protein